MEYMKNLGSINSKLNQKILIYILCSSLLLSICSSFVRFYVDYKENMVQLNLQLNDIEKSYLEPIATGLWDFNESLVQQQIQGVASLPNISYVKITTGFGDTYQYGEERVSVDKVVEYPITYENNNLGILTISTSYRDLHKKLWNKTAFNLLMEVITTFIFVLLSMCIIYWFISRHIYQINHYIKQKHNSHPFTLAHKGNKKDELDLIADSVNALHSEVSQKNIELEEAKRTLTDLKAQIEELKNNK